MQITRQADYITRAVLFHAKTRKGERVVTIQIAKKQNIPPSFLAKIISQLTVVDLLNISRGARGGMTLARGPEDISLLEVIEAHNYPSRSC